MKKLTRAGLRRLFRKRAQELADQLVDELIAIVDDQGLWDDAEVEEQDERRPRRSAAALEETMMQICEVLSRQAEPVAIGVIAEALGTTSRRLTHPMGRLVVQGRVIRTGERRGTRYRLASSKRARKTKSRRKKR